MDYTIVSNGLDEEDDLVALRLGECAELFDTFIGIALAALRGAAMPHNGLDDVACTTVVQALRTRSTLAGQSTSPERCGATPACADIVLHEKTVLHHVGVGPYLLIGIAGHVGIGEEAVRVANLVASRGP